MTSFKLFINLVFIVSFSTLHCHESTAQIHDQIAKIFEKRSQVLTQLDKNINTRSNLESQETYLVKNIGQQKDKISLIEQQYKEKINQVVYWHYNQKKMLWKQMQQSHRELDGPSLCQQLIQGNKKNSQELIRKTTALEKTLQLLDLEKKQYTTIFDEQMLLLAQLDEEEALLKEVLQQMEIELARQEQARSAGDIIVNDKSFVEPFSLTRLLPPLTGLASRSQKEFLGAKIFQAKNGEPIKAISDGTVIFADELKGLGKMVIIEHSDKYMSLYANCSQILKNAGDAVTKNDVIAHVGQSGQIGKEALYFELRHAGEIIPAPDYWLA